MNIFEFDNYRTYLKARLVEKAKTNPSYSLRAMARHLKVGGSTLSEVMSGRTNLSVTNARRIAGLLKLKTEEANYFCDLVLLGAETNPESKELLMDRIEKNYPRAKKPTDLSIELFKQISEWYHLAIMELPLLKEFDFTALNVARAFNISKPLAEIAIERLHTLGFLEHSSKGMRRLHPNFQIRSEIRNLAVSKYFKQMLDIISVALDTQNTKERLSGYLNIPIDREALPEIDRAIDAFIEEVKRISKKYKNRTNVYHLSLHFINLMNQEIKK